MSVRDPLPGTSGTWSSANHLRVEWDYWSTPEGRLEQIFDRQLQRFCGRCQDQIFEAAMSVPVKRRDDA